MQANHAHREPRRYTVCLLDDIAHACMWWPWLFYQVCRCYRDTAGSQACARSSKRRQALIHSPVSRLPWPVSAEASQLLGFQQTPNLDAINTIWLGKAATNLIPRQIRQRQQYCIVYMALRLWRSSSLSGTSPQRCGD